MPLKSGIAAVSGGPALTFDSCMLEPFSKMRSQRAILILALWAASGLAASAPRYRSAAVDAKGRLHIVSEAGKETVLSKTRDQTSFGDPTISPDRQTVIWKVMARDPTRNYFSELPFALAVFRNGRVLHIFATEPILSDWQFEDAGERIAYATGSLDGFARESFLREVVSGRIIEKWSVGDGGAPPEWARAFDFLPLTP